MPDFYKPDLGINPDDAFARETDGKLVRRSFWLDMSDRSVVQAMTQGLGANLANEHTKGRISMISDAPILWIRFVCRKFSRPSDDPVYFNGEKLDGISMVEVISSRCAPADLAKSVQAASLATPARASIRASRLG